MHGVLRRPGNTEIGGQPRQEDTTKPSLPQPAIESRRGAAIILEKRRVAVDIPMKAFSNDDLDAQQVHVAMQCGIWCVLQRVVGPQNLWSIRHLDRIVGFAAWMRAGE